MKKRLVSFSLFGSSPLYLQGAIRNAHLIHRVYPGWVARFYVSQEIPESVVRQLEAADAEVVRKERVGLIDGMFWRFLPASEPGLDAVIVRDVDSRLNLRESSAVKEWLDSGKRLHIMRDHPDHRVPILGGMWGCRGESIPDIQELIEAWKLWAKKGQDQDFLRDTVYLRFCNDSLVHSDFYYYQGEQRRPFPLRRPFGEFVGSVIDAERDDVPRELAIDNELLFANCALQILPPVRARWKWTLWTEQWFRSWRKQAA